MRVSFGKISPRLGILILVVIFLVTSVVVAQSLRSRSLPRMVSIKKLSDVEAEAPFSNQPRGSLANEVVTSCAIVYLPGPSTEVNTAIDLESKRIQLSWWDSHLGANQVVTISYEDPTCEYDPEMKKLVKNALKAFAEINAATCASLTERIRRNDPKLDTEAAKRYLERRCR